MNFSAIFSSEDLMRRLSTNRVIGRSVFSYESVGSTNDVAQRFAKDGARNGTVIISLFQSEGRGRGARRWSAQKGENITTSIILRPNVAFEQLNLLPLLSAVSIAQTIEDISGEPAEIKWPNDVLIRRKKVAGVLIESVVSNGVPEHMIVGMGVNVNQREFPESIADIATSLYLASGRPYDLTTFFIALMQYLDTNYSLFENNNYSRILKMWRSHCKIFGKHITFMQGDKLREGIAIDIDEYGLLKVNTGDKEETFAQAEITSIRY